MSDISEIVMRLEGIGGRLALNPDCVRYSVPRGNQEARELIAELRDRRVEVAVFLKVRRTLPSMPIGVSLVEWKLKEPPVGIDICSIVTDPSLFAETTLEQLRIALTEPKRWVGWTVPQLLERLAQVGVIVTLENRSEVQ